MLFLFFFLVIVALTCQHPMYKIATLELASRFALQVLLDVLARALELAAMPAGLQRRHIDQAAQRLHAPARAIAQKQLQAALLSK